MTEDDTPNADRDPDARIYDYFKHLTTVSLIAIGGVLGLVQGAVKLPGPAILATICVLAAAGAISMTGLNIIASAELRDGVTQIQRARLRRIQPLANTLLMLGLGIFLGVFLRVLP